MLFGKSQYQALQVTADGFTHKGTAYRFDEIAHVFFSHTRVQHRMNFFVDAGETQNAHLVLSMSSGKKIRLSFAELLPIPDKTKDIKHLTDAYLFLAQQSFQSRLQPYLQQLQARGYFVYDDCEFYPGDKIVFRRKEFRISETQLLRGAGYIELKPKDLGIAGRVLREMSFTKIPQFNIQTDTDVILTLLDTYFGVRWN